MKYVIVYILILASSTFSMGQRSEAIRNVDQYLERYLERTPIPGFSIAIVKVLLPSHPPELATS